MRLALAAILISCAGHASAQDISLRSPIDCDLGDTCFIQQYVDRDPGEGVTDYQCSGLSYDGHKGTDFALPSMEMMRAGVDVLAAADGLVKGVRDGMPDTGLTSDNAATLQGRECGNGVIVDHPNGWVTQYCHLRNGSITVRVGQKVTAGETMGLVGKSGRAAFPHVHLSLRKDGKTIDPFDSDGVVACNKPGDNDLWKDAPTYRAGGLIDLGFSTAVPSYASVKDGTAHATTLSPTDRALVIWGFAFGTRKGDIMHLTIEGPQGIVITKDITFKKAQAQSFRAIGKNRITANWPIGTYTGTSILIRDGTTIEQRKTQINLR